MKGIQINRARVEDLFCMRLNSNSINRKNDLHYLVFLEEFCKRLKMGKFLSEWESVRMNFYEG